MKRLFFLIAFATLLGCEDRTPAPPPPGGQLEEKVIVPRPPAAPPRVSLSGATTVYGGPDPADIRCDFVWEELSYSISLNLPAGGEELTSSWLGRMSGGQNVFYGPVSVRVVADPQGRYYSFSSPGRLFDLRLDRSEDPDSGVVTWLGLLTATVDDRYLHLDGFNCLAPEIP